MTLAYRIIRSEHYEIDLVMRCLHNLSTALYRETWRPDFDLLLLLLDYVESFPATFHHPKEEDYFFKAIRLRSPDSARILDKLCADHVEGLDRISELRQSLETYIARPAARGWYCYAARNLACHEREHMRREERTVLPLALQVLSKNDWDETNSAFEQDSNPLLGTKRRKNFDRLFALILRRVPSAVVFDRREMKVA
ncbi:MAG: hemerythrin domain-containing protein [Kiloniellaceae bacterium]